MKSVVFFSICIFSCFASFAQIPVPNSEHLEEYIETAPVEVSDAPVNSYRLFKIQNKYGVIVNNDTVSAAIYDKITNQSDMGFIVKDGNKYGYINAAGKLSLPVIYGSISEVKTGKWPPESIYKVQQKDLYGMVEGLTGKELLPVAYKDILGVNSAKQCVVYNRNGELAIVTDYTKPSAIKPDEVVMYKEALVVKKDSLYGFLINDAFSGFMYHDVESLPSIGSPQKSGTVTAVPFVNYQIRPLGTPVVSLYGMVGLVDAQNQLLIPIENDAIEKETTHNYIITTKGGLKGIYLPKSKKYIPPQYKSVGTDGMSDLIVNLNGKKGIVSITTGETLIEPAYESIMQNGSTFYLVQQNHLYGLIDKQGKVVIPPAYGSMNEMYDFKGIYLVKNSIPNTNPVTNKEDQRAYRPEYIDMYGLINVKGETILPQEYNYIGKFEDKYLLVVTPEPDRKFGLFNLNGTVIVQPQYDFIESVNNRKIKMYRTYKNKLNGFLNAEGKEIYTPMFTKVNGILNANRDLIYPRGFDKHYYMSVTDVKGKTGVIDRFEATMILPVVYDGVYSMLEDDNGWAVFSVSKKGKFGVVDNKNQIVVPFKYDTLDLFKSENWRMETNKKATGFVAVKKGKYGVINLLGEELIPFKYEHIGKIDESGLYKVKVNGQYYVYNQQGTRLSREPYDEIALFEYNGRALAFKDGMMNEIDTLGVPVANKIPMKPHQGYTSMQELKEAFVRAMNAKDDAAVKEFAEKIMPSPHLMYFFSKTDERYRSRTQYLDYQYILEEYNQMLLKVKYYVWQQPSYDRENILGVEDFTVFDRVVPTNKRIGEWAYDNEKYVEKILRNCMKINGYWISSFFAR